MLDKSRMSPFRTGDAMNRRQEKGYTLVELLIVISILTLVAAIAMPDYSSTSDEQLRMVTAEFATAIRFARSESLRTGEPHGFQFLTSQYRIRVFRADTSGSPWTSLWDVYHPLDKTLYDYTFPPDLAGSGVPVTHSPIYRGTCNAVGVVYFDANGTPWCLDPANVLLETYRLDLAAGTEQATVSLDGITGRVTVQ